MHTEAYAAKTSTTECYGWVSMSTLVNQYMLILENNKCGEDTASTTYFM